MSVCFRTNRDVVNKISCSHRYGYSMWKEWMLKYFQKDYGDLRTSRSRKNWWIRLIVEWERSIGSNNTVCNCNVDYRGIYQNAKIVHHNHRMFSKLLILPYIPANRMWFIYLAKDEFLHSKNVCIFSPNVISSLY